jgi:hypothetical protein
MIWLHFTYLLAKHTGTFSIRDSEVSAGAGGVIHCRLLVSCLAVFAIAYLYIYLIY